MALQVIERCHGEIKITKHGKIIEMYDPEHHIWSKGLVGLVIKEECKNANLRDCYIVNRRSYLKQELLANSEKKYVTFLIR